MAVRKKKGQKKKRQQFSKKKKKRKTKKKKKEKKKKNIPYSAFCNPHFASNRKKKKKKKKKKTRTLQKWSILSIVSKQATNHIIFFVMNWQFEKLDSCGHSASKSKLTKTPETGRRCDRVSAKKKKKKTATSCNTATLTCQI
jgi:diaminopimelate epimerase